MKKYLLASCLSLLVLPAAAAAIDCDTPPSCTDLGYVQTASECSGKKTLKCPFDSDQVFCGDLSVKCDVGTYLYSDGKCYTSKQKKGTFVGVVFDAENRLVRLIAPVLNSNGRVWDSSSTLTDLSGLTNCTSDDTAETCNHSGKTNTATIIAALGSNAQAATYCNNLTTGGKTWWLASYKEMRTIGGSTSKAVYMTSDEVSSYAYAGCCTTKVSAVNKTTALNAFFCVTSF